MIRLAALAPLLALGACSGAMQQHPASPTIAPGAQYVAMGSSFAAGAGIGAIKPGTPERCGRTVNNYASLLADALGLKLDDQSCGGATTAHLLRAWDELPAQLDAITADTQLVTITVGGNDLDYMGLLFTASCDPATGRLFQGQRVACQPNAPTMPSEADYAELEAKLVTVASMIGEAAPEAQVVFVQYVSLVPEILCDATPLDDIEAANARQLAARLAELTTSVATQMGALVISADKLSASHTSCDPAPWSRGFPASESEPGAPWHPTALAHAQIARHLTAMLTR